MQYFQERLRGCRGQTGCEGSREIYYIVFEFFQSVLDSVMKTSFTILVLKLPLPQPHYCISIQPINLAKYG